MNLSVSQATKIKTAKDDVVVLNTEKPGSQIG